MKANTETDAQVRALVQRMTDAYQARDIDALMECMTPDADLVMYGTGADEKRIGPDGMRKQAERDWAQTDAISMNFGWMSVSASGNVAWVAADGEFSFSVGGRSMSMAARATFVAEQRNGKWIIAQAHFSTPAVGQEEGSSV
jgi:uncharacterized protein (TIGR02246 family)